MPRLAFRTLLVLLWLLASLTESASAADALPQPELADARREWMPAQYVERPITLPNGTFQMRFTDTAAFIDASERAGWVPEFSLGITSEVEFGVSAPLRYIPSNAKWSALNPTPHLAFAFVDSLEQAAALRASALIPVGTDVDYQLQLQLPIHWRFGNFVRLEFGAEGNVGLAEDVQVNFRAPLGASVQVAQWLFVGLEVAPDVGLHGEQATGADGRVLLGLTFQTRGRAHIDLLGSFFVENAGAGSEGAFSDGAGTLFSFAFFPELY